LVLSKASGSAILGDVFVDGGSLVLEFPYQFGPNAKVTINQGGNWNNSFGTQTLHSFTINTTTLQVLHGLSVMSQLSINAGDHDINSNSAAFANAMSISNGANLRLGANTANSTMVIGAGGLSLNDGTLQLGNPGGNVSALVNLSGNVTSSGTSAISVVNGAGPRLLNLQGSVRTFNVTGGTTTVGATIENGGVFKTGAGSLVLTGSSSYTNSTTVNGGTLVVNGSINGSTVAVENGGTLRGNGSSGPVSVGAGGTLASGGDTVPLSVASLAFAPASEFSMQISGASSDPVSVTGGVSLSGTIALSIEIIAAAIDGTTYTLINSNGISGYAGGGRFAYAGNVLDEGERFMVTSGQEFRISYLADTGRDIVLTAVPEPGSIGLLLGAVTLLGLRRRRRMV
jgi:autotransporter-associated beta strand protein